MKKCIRSIYLYGILSTALFLISTGCSSTRTEGGVTIEKKSGNPLKFW